MSAEMLCDNCRQVHEIGTPHPPPSSRESVIPMSVGTRFIGNVLDRDGHLRHVLARWTNRQGNLDIAAEEIDEFVVELVQALTQ